MATTLATHPVTEAEHSLEQFLTFSLGGDLFGIDILSVQEIKGYNGVTALPNTPAYVSGVMNLRGTVIPVIDLRSRFGLPPQDYTKFTVVIVVTIGSRIVGLVVDAVSDVLDIKPEEIGDRPSIGEQSGTDFIRGIAALPGKLVVLLNTEVLLSAEELVLP